MNVSLMLAMLCGVACGLILVAIILKITKTKKDNGIKCKYDERQIIARGHGFKLGFFTLVIYDFIYGMLGIFSTKQLFDPLLAMTIGIMIAAAVHITYCIWKEAYFSLNEEPKRVLIAFLLIALANILIGIVNISNGEIFTNGVLNFRIVNLLCGFFFFEIFIALGIKKLVNKKEKE